MPSVSGVSHASLSVTDLDRSEHFYSGVLGLKVLMNFGDVRVLIDPPSTFQISLVKHQSHVSAPFTERHIGLDHLGFFAASRAELDAWVTRFDAAGVVYTPVREMPFGYHLNFRDPDNIPLEFYVPNDIVRQGWDVLKTRDVSRGEIDALVRRTLGSTH
jgi:glyoxylase I family protein